MKRCSLVAIFCSLMISGCTREPSIEEVRKTFQYQYFCGTGCRAPDVNVKKTGTGRYSIKYKYLKCPECGREIRSAECSSHNVRKYDGRARAVVDDEGKLHYYFD